MNNTIKKIIKARKVNMGGIYLDQPLPLPGIDQIDPFLLIHHWKHEYPGGQTEKELGVGPHPHRGFSPVTLIFKGGLHHRDSRGNDSKIYAGGTQWMNSGMGIIHSERPVRELAEKGGEFEIIQFWINVPSRHKMEQPSYQPLSKEETRQYISEDAKASVSLVAGTFMGMKSAIRTLSPLLVLTLEIEADGKLTIPLTGNFNSILYLLDGKVEVNSEQELQEKEMAWFEKELPRIFIRGIKKSRAIMLSGEPIQEKVTSYGPFVMNSHTEILQAMADYEKGKMGFLVENFDSK